VAAARAAFWLGFSLYGLREPGRASGWIARSQRLVESTGQDCVERGYLCLPAAQRHLGAGEWTAAGEAARAAAEIGDRFRDRDLSAFARNLHGRALMRLGRIKDGLVLIDEAMLSVASGELTPIITGLIYCMAIAGCQQVYALDRARGTTAPPAGARPNQLVTTRARVSSTAPRSAARRLAGGDREARLVRARPPGAADDASGDGFYQQAETHRLRGEGTEAEEAYRKPAGRARAPAGPPSCA
jgi:hypothetical protein